MSLSDDERALPGRVAGEMPRALHDLTELVALRSVADASVEDPAQCRLAAEWVRDALHDAGLTDAALVTTPDGTDAVIAHHDGPDGAPRVLLYAHYDVQPAGSPDAWRTPPFVLTESGGRLYGRGAADCKGNIVAHLVALRALRAEGDYPVSLTVVVEGSEEQGTAGLERYVQAHPQEFAADAILIQDTGNVAVGVPTLTIALRGVSDVVVHVEALAGELHSGAFGGAAPDALAALVSMLATLRDADGNTTVRGLDAAGTWDGSPYDPEDFRRDAGVLDGVRLLGSGAVADMVWARPTVTILGIDAPAVIGSVAAIQPRASARLNLRLPPGTDPEQAGRALADHLHAVAPWGVRVRVEPDGSGAPFRARTDTEVFATLRTALSDAFGRETVTTGQGGSIPLTAALARAQPDAAIVMLGVAEPASQMHAPNESVHPDEIEHIALGEALFLRRLGRGGPAGDRSTRAR